MAIVTSPDNLSVQYTSPPFFVGSLTSDINFTVLDLDTPIPLGFNGAVNGPTDPIQSDAAGLLTVNQAGRYLIEALPALAKSSVIGQVKFVFRQRHTRGVTVTDSDMILGTLNPDQHNQTNPIYFDVDLQKDDTIEYFIWPDSSAGTSGGLLTDTISLDTQTTPSWCVKIQRIWREYP